MLPITVHERNCRLSLWVGWWQASKSAEIIACRFLLSFNPCKTYTSNFWIFPIEWNWRYCGKIPLSLLISSSLPKIFVNKLIQLLLIDLTGVSHARLQGHNYCLWVIWTNFELSYDAPVLYHIRHKSINLLLWLICCITLCGILIMHRNQKMLKMLFWFFVLTFCCILMLRREQINIST